MDLRIVRTSELKLAVVFLLAVFAGFTFSHVDTGILEQFEFDTADLSGQNRPNIIIIDVDRLAADHMPCYGYYRNTTPNMCEFGKENIIFKDAVSQAGWTAASTASVFTGQYTPVHRLKDHNDRLNESRLTLAELLKRKGYTTAAFPAVPMKNPAFLHRGYNVDQGFETYYVGNYFIKQQIPDVREWLNSSRSEKPFFLYIQGFGPHQYNTWFKPTERKFSTDMDIWENLSDEEVVKLPYPSHIVMKHGEYYLRIEGGPDRPMTSEEVDNIVAQYDDIIYQSDKSVGKLLNLLRRKGLYSDSIIILMANHGEMLDVKTFAGIDRRFGHGSVWEDDINVPLMMHIPEEESEVITRQTEFIDILPTLLDEMDMPMDEELRNRLQGESLTPLYSKQTLLSDSEDYSGGYAFTTDYGAGLHAVRNSTWKLIVFPDGGKQLYNIEKDPNENHNLIGEYPEITRSLEAALARHRLTNQRLVSEIY